MRHNVYLSLLVILILVVLAGCGGYFAASRYETAAVSKEQLEEIDNVAIEELSREKAAEKDMEVAEPNKVELTIEQCRAYALEGNLELRMELYNPQVAREQVGIARAAFEPSAFAQYNFAQADTPVASELDASEEGQNYQSESIYFNWGFEFPLRTGGTITAQNPFNQFETNNQFSLLNPSYTADVSVRLQQPLLRGAGVRTNTHAIRIAKYNSRLAQAQVKLNAIAVLNSVDVQYWSLYAAREGLAVRRQEYELAREQWEQAKRMAAAGQVSEIEILRAETAMAQRYETIIEQEKNLQRMQRALKAFLNQEHLPQQSRTEIRIVTSPDPQHYIIERDKLVAFALDKRMELVELSLTLAKDASTIDWQRNNLLPYLSLDYTYNVNGLGETTGRAYRMMERGDFVDHRVGLTLSVPLGNQAAKGQLRQAILTRLQHLAERKRREQEIERQALNAADALEYAWQKVVAGRESVRLARRTMEAEQRQFDLGLQNSTEVLDAQTQFANAQSALIGAIVDYQLAQVDLAYAAGCTLGVAKVHWESALKTDEQIEGNMKPLSPLK